MRLRTLASLLATASLLTACGGDDDDGPTTPSGAGSFAASVTGDLTRANITGQAGHASIDEAGTEDDGFVIVLSTDDENENIPEFLLAFGRDNPARPGTGTHTLATDDTPTANEFIGIIG